MLVCLVLISCAFAGGLHFAGRRCALDRGPSSHKSGTWQSHSAPLFATVRSPYIATLVLVTLAATSLGLWMSAHHSQFGWDGWVHHASAVAWFHQQDAIVPVPWMPFGIGYPKNIEFLGLWAFRFDGDDSHIDMVNILLHRHPRTDSTP